MNVPQSLDARLDADFAPAWRPEPGEKIVGEVVAISEREGSFGRYPIVTLRGPRGGERAIHAFHTVLRDKLAESAPAIGERLGVKYEGKVQGNGREGYHAYKVIVDRADGGIDWAAYADGHDQVAAGPAEVSPPPAEPARPEPELPPMRLPARPSRAEPVHPDQGAIGDAGDEIPF